MTSLRKNAACNVAYQVLRVMFPLLTYPHVSSVIGPTGIGLVTYAFTGVLYQSIDTTMLGAMVEDQRYSAGLYTIVGRGLRIALDMIVAGQPSISPASRAPKKGG